MPPSPQGEGKDLFPIKYLRLEEKMARSDGSGVKLFVIFTNNFALKLQFIKCYYKIRLHAKSQRS